eukprot:10944074-Alexandrium_andersonii.AAC.1
MSASLVGSEMCIRDSNYALSGASGQSWLIRTSTSRRGPSMPNGPSGTLPVSYTHLTAADDM